MILTPQQVYNFARNAGFDSDVTILILGIAKVESGFNPFIIGYNTRADGSFTSIDRGLMQWNSYWHKEVTDEMAFTPALCMKEVYRVSAGGKDFSAWDDSNQGGQHEIEAAKFRVFQADFEFQYQASKQPLPMPDAGEFAMTMGTAAHFRRMGLAYDGLIDSDKASIKWLNQQVNP